MKSTPRVSLILLPLFFFCEANANIKCGQLFIESSLFTEDAAISAQLKNFFAPLQPDEVKAKDSTSPTIYFYQGLRGEPFNRQFGYQVNEMLHTQLITNTIYSAARIATAAGLYFPPEIYVNGLIKGSGSYDTGTRVMSTPDRGHFRKIQHVAAHEFGHAIFDYSLRNRLPPKYREMYRSFGDFNLNLNLRMRSPVPKNNDLVLSVFESVRGLNELFGDVVAMLANNTIITAENLSELTGFMGDAQNTGQSFVDNQTLSSAKLIAASPDGQHGVLAHMRAWLGQHRLKENMSDDYKARLLKSLMDTNVALVTEAFDKAFEIAPNRILKMTTHSELVKANLKYLETFLRVESSLNAAPSE